MISHRVLIFAGAAMALNLLLVLFIGAALISLNFGLAILFSISFILVPVFAAFIAGYRSIPQMLIILVLTIVIGAFLSTQSFITANAWAALIGSIITYLGAASAAEMLQI